MATVYSDDAEAYYSFDVGHWETSLPIHRAFFVLGVILPIYTLATTALLFWNRHLPDIQRRNVWVSVGKRKEPLLLLPQSEFNATTPPPSIASHPECSGSRSVDRVFLSRHELGLGVSVLAGSVGEQHALAVVVLNVYGPWSEAGGASFGHRRKNGGTGRVSGIDQGQKKPKPFHNQKTTT
jgi:hypothetical protein